MPRYFFDFRQGSDRSADAEGLEFSSVEQAYLEAFRGAQDMWSELLRRRQDPRRCRFEVRNENRELLFALPLQEVVEACRDRQSAAVQQNIERSLQLLDETKRISDQFLEQLRAVNQTLAESRALLRVHS